MIYEQTSGTSPDDIYGNNVLEQFFLLLETGGYLLLETGGRVLLENSSNTRPQIFYESSGESPDPIYGTDSVTGSLFENTSGTSPDNPYEEN